MRGSQFQSSSALESITQNQSYLKHREHLNTIKHTTGFLSPKRGGTHNYIVNLQQELREFKRDKATTTLESENMRLLRKLLEIKQGDKATVAKADSWKSRPFQNSPLVKDRGHVNFAADSARVMSGNKKII